MHDQALGAGRVDPAREVAQERIAVLIVDTDSCLHGDRDSHGGLHRGHAIGHQRWLGHQAGPECTVLDPIRRAADIDIDLIEPGLFGQPADYPAIKTVCDRHDVPLKAAALQFGLAHPAVAATIPGAVTPSEVEENVQMVAYPIPADLWAELKHEDLIPVDAPVPRP